MFIRCKESSQWLNVVIVQSVRRNGKPRQDIIGSIKVRQDADEKIALLWNTFEDYLTELDLSPDTRKEVIDSLGRKFTRPNEEELTRRRELSAAKQSMQDKLLRQLMGDDWQKNVVPDNPPTLGNDDTTADENSPLFIKWKVSQPVPKYGTPAKYTAYLIKRSSQKQEFSIKLNSEEIEADLLKKARLYKGELHVQWAWKSFWYDVHRHLILAHVDIETYKTTIRLLSKWVICPDPDELLAIVEGHLYSEMNHVDNREKELTRSIENNLKKRQKLYEVYSKSPEYLNVNHITPHYV